MSTPASFRGGHRRSEPQRARATRVARVLKKAKIEMPPRSGGALRRLAVSTPVAWTYHLILVEFFIFASFLGLTKELNLPAQGAVLDLACSEFCDHMYMEGHPAYIGERLFAAL